MGITLQPYTFTNTPITTCSTGIHGKILSFKKHPCNKMPQNFNMLRITQNKPVEIGEITMCSKSILTVSQWCEQQNALDYSL